MSPSCFKDTLAAWSNRLPPFATLVALLAGVSVLQWQPVIAQAAQGARIVAVSRLPADNAMLAPTAPGDLALPSGLRYRDESAPVPQHPSEQTDRRTTQPWQPESSWEAEAARTATAFPGSPEVFADPSRPGHMFIYYSPPPGVPNVARPPVPYPPEAYTVPQPGRLPEGVIIPPPVFPYPLPLSNSAIAAPASLPLQAAVAHASWTQTPASPNVVFPPQSQIAPLENLPRSVITESIPTNRDQVLNSQIEFLENVDGMPASGWYLRSEALAWWMTGMHLPPLVTESPPGTPQVDSGVLGAPGTVILFGNDGVNTRAAPGFRFTAGRFLGPCSDKCLEVSGFGVFGNSTRFLDGSDGTRRISRPFLDAATGEQTSQLVSFPGVLSGTVNIVADRDPLWGLSASLRQPFLLGCNYQVHWLSGIRYLNFNESLGITENLLPLNGIPGTNIVVRDNFITGNQFFGVDFGCDGTYRMGRWNVRGLAKLAFGQVQNHVRIAGSTTVSVPGDPIDRNPGGLLAQVSNIGVYNEFNWTLIPEAAMSLEYQIRPNLTLGVGYNVMWWMNVVRPGDQIDMVVNSNQIPPSVPPVDGPERPRFLFNPNSLWIHGLNVSLDFRF